jgi:hypothetical protein
MATSSARLPSAPRLVIARFLSTHWSAGRRQGRIKVGEPGIKKASTSATDQVGIRVARIRRTQPARDRYRSNTVAAFTAG